MSPGRKPLYDYEDLRDKLTAIIDEESNTRLMRYSPLSDRSLAEIFRCEHGVYVDNKTIFNARQELDIPASTARRRMYLQELFAIKPKAKAK